MRVRIKVCGITSVTDAMSAVDEGVDALGFMLWPKSKRAIHVQEAAKIARLLPPFVSKVGVFVNASADEVKDAVAAIGLDTIQLHGEETPDFCWQFAPTKVVKAFRIKNAESLKTLPNYETDAWLLDSYVAGEQGGTGAMFNWDLAVQAKDLGRPIMLAGGLNPDNIAQAVHEVWPYAVDVSSGVESAPGKKDRNLIRQFVEAVRSIETVRV